MLLDLELGRESELTHYDWITDTTVHDGSAWAYMKYQNINQQLI